MQKFETLTAVAAPILMPNIDTDVIMPKQFLKRIDREGLAEGVFHDARRTEGGLLREDFPLNQERYRGAQILLAGRNFGCGSSREHAVWGLMQSGIRVVIAPSFAGIFFGNCEKNGLLAIVLSEEETNRIAGTIKEASQADLTIDLERCVICLPGGEQLPFDIEPTRRRNLLEGHDHIEVTLTMADRIRAFEVQHLTNYKWLEKHG